ncbi:MAG: type II toxin-antitoxin system RelE/ParE family toxin [Patescibacteria group bacterium]
MKKKVFYDDNALKELQTFTESIRDDFDGLVRMLRNEGRLAYPDARKIGRELFEIRLMDGGAYRGFYAYVWEEHVVILHFFQKKSQKTPLHNIKTALNRLLRYK